jgi:peptide/nickel transport system ATP-binding protein
VDRQPLLSVEDLHVRFETRRGTVHAVNGISFDIAPGETLGIVGESGCGKSVTSLAILGLLARNGRVESGRAIFEGRDLLRQSDRALRSVRGKEIAMIFQDPMTSLNPVLTIGRQIREALETHMGMKRKEAERTAAEALDRVGIPSADVRLKDYPHQFSGGMRQRAMIAMGLVNDPSMLIADEPTTALDVTVQAQILDLLQDLQKEFNSAIIIITHDLGVVAEMTDDTSVMYGGRAVEYGKTSEILTHPEMPYTWGLLSSVPEVTGDTSAKLIPIPGNPPSLLNPPSGCHFHPRCAFRDKVPGDLCRTTTPELAPGNRGSTHLKRCHLADPEAIYRTEVLPEIAPDLVEQLGEKSGS